MQQDANGTKGIVTSEVCDGEDGSNNGILKMRLLGVDLLSSCPCPGETVSPWLSEAFSGRPT